MSSVPSLTTIWIAGTCLKILLFSGYRSTDFEVHRNWLAITYNLPISQWYTDTTSQWTLDYPPFFAWFEWVLSHLAPQCVKDDGALELVELGDIGMPTVIYQRLTVIVSEIILFAALKWYIDSIKKTTKSKLESFRAYAVALSIATSPGLFIIDHIHFQYNGFMYGIMVFSIVALYNRRFFLGAALFASLLCFKHIYLYLAPAYFMYLLRMVVITNKQPRDQVEHTIQPKKDRKNHETKSSKQTSGKKKKSPGEQSKEKKESNDSRAGSTNNLLPGVSLNIKDTVRLAVCTMLPFIVAFGPFAFQLDKVLARLFPFSRGLTHAYWAPNVWALYSFVDRVLTFIWFKDAHVAGSTRGLVGDVAFGVLPEIQPKLTFFLTLFYQILALVPLAIWPTFDRFLTSLALCGFASFLFGWHVHEKAILLIIFPFSFLALKDRRILTAFVPVAVAGYISLFPLIYTSGEQLIKMLYTFAWFVTFMLTFHNLADIRNTNRRVFLLDRLTFFYMVGFVPLMACCELVLPQILPHYSFLGLMIISVYCSIGIVGSWFGLSWLYFFDDQLYAN